MYVDNKVQRVNNLVTIAIYFHYVASLQICNSTDKFREYLKLMYLSCVAEGFPHAGLKFVVTLLLFKTFLKTT